MWQQNYTPIADNLGLSALVAAIPIFTLLFLLGVKRKPAWKASLAGLGAAAVVALAVYGMPLMKLVEAITYGAAFGLFPIGWVVFAAILLYRVTLESGKFEIVKDSIGNLTGDRRLQTLLIAVAFSGFIEGAAGFGTPIAVAGAMLAGLGFSPFYAAGLCLLANTAPVSFGSIGTPIITLAVTTGLPIERLSAGVGRICSPLALIVPAYVILVMGGWRALRGVLPAAIVCGVAFAGAQFYISNFVSVQLTGILSSLAAMASLVILLKVWKPSDLFELGAEHGGGGTAGAGAAPARHHTGGELFIAWSPYLLLVIFVLLWGYKPTQQYLNSVSTVFAWPGLHNTIQRVPPVVAKASPYAAMYNFNWLSASGTACLLAAVVSSFLVGLKPNQLGKAFVHTAKQLALAELTLAAVVGLAFLMNYSGATATLGLAFAATGVLFPFFSAWLGWLGVFLTGSDTSANALFGNLQVVTATKLGMNPVLMAASNSSGGVVGKMISLTSVAVAAAATSMKSEDESLLFRFTLKHSLLMTALMGLIVVFYAYVMPSWAP
jgi:L-lactate transport